MANDGSTLKKNLYNIVYLHDCTYLVWSEFIDEVVHVDKENCEILNLLIPLGVNKVQN